MTGDVMKQIETGLQPTWDALFQSEDKFDAMDAYYLQKYHD